MSVILFLIGVLLLVLSHPRIRRAVLSRMFNEGWLVPQSVVPEKAEIVKFAGPSLSLFVLGVAFLILGVISRNF